MEKYRIYNFFWLVVTVLTFVFWYFIYKFSTTEYDENANNLAYAILSSVSTMFLLIYVKNNDKLQDQKKEIAFHFTFFLGTPIAFSYIIFYVGIFKMNYISTTISSKSNRSYKVEKFRNFFNARNTIITECYSQNPDTIVCIVKKNNSIKKLYKLKNGIETKIDLTEQKDLSKEQKNELTHY